MDTSLIAGSIAAAAAIAAIIAFLRVFNQLIGARNRSRNARGSIEANLKKRHDLVPNLVAVVKGYAGHERETLERLIAARNAAKRSLGTSASAREEGHLTAALFTLEARVEAYPALRADEHFSHLQRTLVELEEQISAARRAFNAQVLVLNNLVARFPTLIVARATGFAEMPFFEAGAAAREAPGVDLRENAHG